MTPTAFDEANVIFDHPHPDVLPINACIATTEHGVVIVTCWKITIEEIEEFKRTGRIYLTVYGPGMPIVSLTAQNPFK